jgi:hypothetical protein
MVLAVAAAATVIGVAQRSGDTPPAVESAADRLSMVNEKVKRGELREAATELEKILRDDPSNEAAREWLERLSAATEDDSP